MISPTAQAVTITATGPTGAKRHCELEPDQGVFVGKSSNCGLQLPGDDLSDIHCRIWSEEGELWVQDWMSVEGTSVNGKTISTSAKFTEDDIVNVGQHQITIGHGVVKSDGDQESPSTAAGDPPSAGPTSPVAPSAPQSAAPEPQQQTTAPPPPAAAEPQPAASTAVSTDEPEESSPLDALAKLRAEVAQATGSDSLDRDAEQSTQASPEESAAVDQTRIDGAAPAEAPPARGEPAMTVETDHADETLDSDPIDFDADFFGFEEEETYDRETVALLQAEIEDLQSQLAQRDAQQFQQPTVAGEGPQDESEPTDEVLQRMQELIEEANRSDERVALLEEMLHVAEEANRSEIEERNQLEGWVSDIERRIGQREEEHTAELDALRQRLEESSELQHRLQQQLRQAATGGSAPQHYEETLDNLQVDNKRLQDELAETQKQCRVLQQQVEQASSGSEEALHGERAELAQEKAKIARMRHELTSKLGDVHELPKAENQVDREAAERLRTLREHLREIHEQEKQEEKEASLATRLTKLWKRVEY